MEKTAAQEKLAKKVNEYFKLMQKKLKEWHGKDIKTPLQLDKKERANFFKKLDKFKTKGEEPKKEEKEAKKNKKNN